MVLLSIFHFLPSTFEIYPCRCLCLGFSQITRITPFLFTILHLSQIFLTDALTFTTSTSIRYSIRQPENFTLNLTWFRVYFSRKIILPRERS
jgi:hypothetical protein